MDVLTAVHHRGRSKYMTTMIDDQATAAATGQEQKPENKGNTAPRKPRVAASKGKSGKKTTSAKKAPKAPKKAKAAKAEGAREGSKTATVLALIQRAKGATLAEIMEATGWQAHSVRGFISGTLGKEMALKVESTKREDGERVYSLSK
jgi:hypothetical protein